MRVGEGAECCRVRVPGVRRVAARGRRLRATFVFVFVGASGRASTCLRRL